MKKPFVDNTVIELVELKRKFYREIGNNYIKALPGAVELDALHERHVPVAIASSASKDSVSMMDILPPKLDEIIKGI